MKPSRELLLKAFPMLESFPEIDLLALMTLSDSLVPEGMDERRSTYWGAGFRYAAQGKEQCSNRSYMVLRDSNPEAFDAGVAACEKALEEAAHENQN